MSDGPIWESDDGAFIRILVRPKSKERALISELTDEFLVLNIKSPAREGKANMELLKQLSRFLGVSTGDVMLVSGHKSREKIVKVAGFRKEQLIELVTNDK